jgi:hypothetical protein
MTFDEWWTQHPYSYADNEEQLKESCKMAWEAAYEEGRAANESSDFPLRDVEFLKKCTGIIRMDVKRVQLSMSCIKIDFHNGDSWYHEYPSKQLLIKVDQLMYTW